jgi:dTDP-4-dehydrorhamnose reductase/beta-phosphoglucomutase-like phosphatase (HAD superfamily)
MNSNTKILVCGGSGLLGRSLMQELKNKNITAVGTYNSNPSENLIYIDFQNIDEMEKQFLEINPTVCVSTIAERQNEICENNWDKIKKINIDIVQNIASICKKHNIYLIHLSTDYVYDGLSPPFGPSSLTNPLQNYGISKLIAEQRIQSIYKNEHKFLILRVPVLYSNEMRNLSESAVTLIMKQVMNKVSTFNEDNYCIRRPVFITDLCEFIVNCITYRSLNGVHCFYNPFEKFTKYEIAQLGAELLNTNVEHIIPTQRSLFDKALRPIDTELFDEEIHNEIINNKFEITLLKEGLKEALSKFIHPKINFCDTNVNKDKFFFMMDLDGTLVDSEVFQWKSYKDALKDFNIEYSFGEFTAICHNGDIKSHLKNKYNFTDEMYSDMKNKKKLYMKNHENLLKLVDGADMFIDYLIINDLNHVVVTNSSIDTIELYKSAIPKLNEIKNWVMREDYTNAKPSPECYNLAISRYYKKEENIVGFENSLSGYESLKNVTDKIYFITYTKYLFYEKIVKEDVFLINTFNDV